MAKKDTSIKNKKEIFCWAMYDWANSAFATTVLAFVFAMYYSKDVALGKKGFLWHGLKLNGASLWAYIVGVSLFLVAVCSPILGAFVDFMGVKKKFLFAFCYIGAAATCLMFFVKGGREGQPGNWILGGILFIIANFAFAGGNVFYNAFLPDIATKENMGKVSGIGWAVGYIGGPALLILNLAMIRKPKLFGFPDTETGIRFSILTAGIWWAIFAIPIFIWVKERAKPKPLPKGKGYIGYTFFRIGHTFKKIANYKMLLFFLLAFLFYNDAIQTVINQATNFGINEIKLKIDWIIICGIIIQFVAIFGALGFGFLEPKLGTKRTIIIALIIWLMIIGYAYFIPASYKIVTINARQGSILTLSDAKLVSNQIPNPFFAVERIRELKEEKKETVIENLLPLKRLEFLNIRCMKPFGKAENEITADFYVKKFPEEKERLIKQYYKSANFDNVRKKIKYEDFKKNFEGAEKFKHIPLTEREKKYYYHCDIENYYVPGIDYQVDMEKNTLTIISKKMADTDVSITFVPCFIKFIIFDLSSAAFNFLILSIAVGFVMGGSQASSRSMLAQFTPKENAAEFFGFFATMGKFASIFGPIIFGFVNQITGSLRIGILALGSFIIVGMILLGILVDEEKGKEQSKIAIE